MSDEPMFCRVHSTPMRDLSPSLAERQLVCPRCLNARVTQLECALAQIIDLTAGAEDLLAVHGWTAVAGRKLLQVRTAATSALEGTPCPEKV